MKLKRIEFAQKNAQRVYDNYMKSVETAIRPLSKASRLDIWMEFNSHIYESMQSKSEESEMNRLLDAIDRLGTPEDVLKPLIADKMLEKATRTFNPIDVIRALIFNIANGISYIIFAFLYLFLFIFIFLIGAKLTNPDVGMYFKDGKFEALGIVIGGEGYYEVLGNWFIPVMILCAVAQYFFITFLLKLKKSFTKSKTMKSVITSIAFLFICHIGFGQNTEFAKLDSYFSILEENDRFFGSVAVSKAGEVIYSKAIGYADMEKEVLNNSETKFRIGSISKTFTATLIMKAVEMGKINLDDSIHEYFPRIENAEKITVRNLLNHRSGIGDFTRDQDYRNWYKKPVTQAGLMDIIISQGSDFEPDSKYRYCNSNYVLLTFILESIFETSFGHVLEHYITEPLNLANTGYGGEIDPLRNEAYSYRMKDEWDLNPETNMSIPLGAGGIISTPTDLCIFSEALFSGQLISTESLQHMRPLDDDSYGFALEGQTFDNLTGIGHGGDIDAFSSTLAYFEEEDICFALICNGSNYGKHDVSLAVLNEVFGKPYELPSFEFVDLSSEELDQYVGTYETDELPMDIIVSKEGNKLLLGVTGQTSSPIDAEGDHKFSEMKYGVKIQFFPEEKKMLFEQHGMKFELSMKQPTDSVDISAPVEITDEDFNQYLGTYTSDELPMDITFSKEGNELISQATGQSPFPLKAEGQHVFSRAKSGIKITFIPQEKKVLLEQHGMKFEMIRNKSSQSAESSNPDLDQYLGTYKSDKLPIDLTISKEENTLIAQGTGQPSFNLVSEGNHTFSNKEIGLKITFVPSEKKLFFVQGTAEFEMTL